MNDERPPEPNTAVRRDPALPSTYDAVTISLHWALAFLVLNQFALALTWRRLPKGAVAQTLQHAHVSLGLVLFVVLVVNTIWTTVKARRLPKMNRSVQGFAALAVHRAFVLLIFLQVVFGVSKRWVRSQGVEVFGLGRIPAPFHLPADLRPILDMAHRLNAYLIMSLVALHVGAALLHHYVMKDGVLRRMIPTLRPQGV